MMRQQRRPSWLTSGGGNTNADELEVRCHNRNSNQNNHRHRRSNSNGAAVDTSSNVTSVANASFIQNNVVGHTVLRKSTSAGLESSPVLPPLTTLTEGVAACDTDAPHIPNSSSPGTPPKKVWERSYRNFLKMRVGGGGKQVDNGASSSNVPSLPAAPPQLLQRQSSGSSHSRRGRTSSLSSETSKDGSDKESSVRGGKLFANVFRGGSSDNNHHSSSSSGGRRKGAKTLSSDELDGTLRRGTEKAYSPGNTRYHPVLKMPSSSSMPQMMNNDDVSVPTAIGTDAIGAGQGFSNNQRTVSDKTTPRSASTGEFGVIHPRLSSSEDDNQSPAHELALELALGANNNAAAVTASRRNSPPLTTSVAETVGTAVAVAATTSRAGRPRGYSKSAPSSPVGGPKHAIAVCEEDEDGNDNDSKKDERIQSMINLSANPLLVPIPGGMGAAAGVIMSEHSSASSFSSAMKKAFTEFHNSSSTGRDACSSFLGDEPSHRQSAAGHSLTWTQNQQRLQLIDSLSSNKPGARCSSQGDLTEHDTGGNQPGMHTGNSFSLNDVYPDKLKRGYSDQHATIHHGGRSCGVLAGGISPLDAIFENVMIHKDLRVLKPIQSVDAWQTGRRYLIAPAALAACPMTVLTTMTGNNPPIDAVQACTRFLDDTKMSVCAFGSILLGPCLLSCSSQSSTCPHGRPQWSSAVLVLRQNYLLEYSPGVSVNGIPRGFAHLQYAHCHTNADFPDALELHFYGSPCAKSDKRVLMMRIQKREERDYWMKCLNRASSLRVEDLYEFDEKKQLGKGSYATVYTAKRRLAASDDDAGNNSQRLCALKIFDKNQYWRMVVKGRERADTLVRETSVQSTVTAKCGRIDSFVKIFGFFETADQVVIELELLEGTDLFKYISSKGVLKEVDAARILRDILQSLEAMNRIGLAHRDIKPANILMCSGSRYASACKVADFGMSTFVGVDGHLRGRCGTPGYVAPEIFTAGLHGGYGNKVDIFSAGVTLYVMLCGYEPFYGETDSELIQANKDATIDFPDEEWKGVSASAKDLVQKMMHPDPARRLNASEALKHPWFQFHLPDSARPFNRSTTLPDSETLANDACVIS